MRECNCDLYGCYVDLIKAYDMINRKLLFHIIKAFFPLKFANAIISTMDEATAQIQLNGKLLEKFITKCGLKQGSILSPILFDLYLSIITKICHAVYNRKNIRGIQLSIDKKNDFISKPKTKTSNNIIYIFDVFFADDAVLLATSAEELQTMIDIFVSNLNIFGQTVSHEKTTIMINKSQRKSTEVYPKFYIKYGETSHELKLTETTKYLGIFENNINNDYHDIQMKIRNMWYQYSKDKAFYTNQQVSLKSRLYLAKTLLIPAALYGSAI